MEKKRVSITEINGHGGYSPNFKPTLYMNLK